MKTSCDNKKTLIKELTGDNLNLFPAPYPSINHSASPPEYAFSQSKKLMPSSKAVFILCFAMSIIILSVSRVIQLPTEISLTFNPHPPSFLYSIIPSSSLNNDMIFHSNIVLSTTAAGIIIGFIQSFSHNITFITYPFAVSISNVPLISFFLTPTSIPSVL